MVAGRLKTPLAESVQWTQSPSGIAPGSGAPGNQVPVTRSGISDRGFGIQDSGFREDKNGSGVWGNT